MSNQNIFEFVTDDPVRFNMLALKSKLFMVLVNLIRKQNWSQAEAARQLKVSQPRMSNLFKGQLDKFSIDTLLEMIMGIGYKLDMDFDPNNDDEPLELTLKKAML
ncbi:helix-turn-helix domain-containing protein [Pseudomonas sp. FSL W7-0098]|uniref:helix-turn-helix domain-containing protein n=1 Tax=Pseudomonas sp. FSL W7-0098 TaxID=2496120 RepID=UPI00110CC741|nr:XRE family transcriptional regulator [Pseudomonas sp. FSL W7-0098]